MNPVLRSLEGLSAASLSSRVRPLRALVLIGSAFWGHPLFVHGALIAAGSVPREYRVPVPEALALTSRLTSAIVVDTLQPW